MNADQRSTFIKQLAIEYGFSFCGISKAEELTAEAFKLEQWLKAGHHGRMGYMENHFEKRIDPRKLVEGAKTVVSLMFNYYTVEKNTTGPKISKYAYGKDYHLVLKEKLYAIMEELRHHWGEIHGRAFVDSAPVLEKAWARKSGLGWLGKNANLINKQQGSFFFLAELILDIEISPDAALQKNYCGTCTACVDACPTDAILGNGEVDGSKCISYFTIELKDSIPAEMKNKFANWAFGCDICQDICPWNRFSKEHEEPGFRIKDEILNFSEDDWMEITEDVFKKAFKDSPLSRTGYKGLKRNLHFLYDDPEISQ
jgi:epoxyqueuosine reductase